MQNDMNLYISESKAYANFSTVWLIKMKIKMDNYTLIFEQEISNLLDVLETLRIGSLVSLRDYWNFMNDMSYTDCDFELYTFNCVPLLQICVWQPDPNFKMWPATIIVTIFFKKFCSINFIF